MVFSGPDGSETVVPQCELDGPRDQIRQLCLRVRVLFGRQPLQGVDGVVEQHRENLVLALEVAVNSRWCHARQSSDCSHSHPVEASLVKQLLCCLEDRLLSTHEGKYDA